MQAYTTAKKICKNIKDQTYDIKEDNKYLVHV